MEKIPIHKYRVKQSISAINRRDWVKYLIVVNLSRELEELATLEPTLEFQKFVDRELNAYVAGKAPPAEIATPLMNIAEYHLTGNPIVLRAGDYIALQGYFKKLK